MTKNWRERFLGFSMRLIQGQRVAKASSKLPRREPEAHARGLHRQTATARAAGESRSPTRSGENGR
jgi:hypothetical protein